MNRRTALALTTMALSGVALSTGAAMAQQKSLKEQLVGTWMFVSCDSTDANGAKLPYCVNPNGILILDAGGRFALVFAARGRPKLTTGNRLEAPAEQFKAAAVGVAAGFGTWSVNEADKTLTRHNESNLLPNLEGTDIKASVNLVGDELRLAAPISGFGGRAEGVLRRAK